MAVSRPTDEAVVNYINLTVELIHSHSQGDFEKAREWLLSVLDKELVAYGDDRLREAFFGSANEKSKPLSADQQRLVKLYAERSYLQSQLGESPNRDDNINNKLANMTYEMTRLEGVLSEAEIKQAQLHLEVQEDLVDVLQNNPHEFGASPLLDAKASSFTGSGQSQEDYQSFDAFKDDFEQSVAAGFAQAGFRAADAPESEAPESDSDRNRLERLYEKRDELLNNFGGSAFHDGLVQQELDRVDREIDSLKEDDEIDAALRGMEENGLGNDDEDADLDDSIDDELESESESYSPPKALVELTNAGELRRSLLTGVVCLTDTDNTGAVRHLFVTQHRPFMAHMAGRAVFLSDSTNTKVQAYDLVAGREVTIEPDYFTGAAHVVGNFGEPKNGLEQAAGHLVLDTVAGALFVTSLPETLPVHARSVHAIAGVMPDGGLGGVYPYVPKAPSAKRDAERSADTSEPGL